MVYNKNYEIKKDLKNCLIQLDLLFQWLAAVENRTIEKDGTKMGSNFAKFKIIPEYCDSDFIDYACKAEKHFSEVIDDNYYVVGHDCRMSLEGFMTYLYKTKHLKINEEYFKHSVDDEALWNESNRIRDNKETNPTGYELGTKKEKDEKTRKLGDNHGKPITKKGKDEKTRKLFWLDAAITSKDFQDFFNDHNAWPNAKEKKLAAEFSHYKDKKFYTGEKALSILAMIYNLYSHCTDKQLFAGTPHFDVSLLENVPTELIKPQLSIEVNGKEEEIPQNALLEAVYNKEVSDALIKENLSLINKTDVLGNTPLSLAVYNDDFETVKTLLENGADPNFFFKNLDFENCQGDFYKSVFEEISKDEEKYKLVLDDYIEGHNCIPLIIAMKKDNFDIVRLLLQNSAHLSVNPLLLILFHQYKFRKRHICF